MKMEASNLAEQLTWQTNNNPNQTELGPWGPDIDMEMKNGCTDRKSSWQIQCTL